MNNETIAKDPKVIQWFSLIRAADKTKAAYIPSIKLYCELAERTPTQLITEAIQEIKAGKMPSERADFGYISQFLNFLQEEKYAGNTITLHISAVKSFYKCYDIILSSALGKNHKTLPLKRNMGMLEKADIVRMLKAAKSLRDRAIILSMPTSGMGRQEIINLLLDDIEKDPSGIGIVSIRREKEQVDYVTFLSPEAMHAIDDYMDERKRAGIESPYVFVSYSAQNVTAGEQMSENAFLKIFTHLSEELGYAKKGQFSKSRSHGLRKWFASVMMNSGTPKHLIDHWLGHTQNTTDGAYFKFDLDKMKEVYIRHLPHITFEKEIVVNTLSGEDAKTLHAENENLKLEIRKQDALLKYVLGELSKELNVTIEPPK